MKTQAIAALMFSASLSGLTFQAMAQSDDVKAQVQAEAAALCQSNAQSRYGDTSIKSMSEKVKWSNGLKGAVVKMKIKPEKKRASKYSCVVSADRTVTFYKA